MGTSYRVVVVTRDTVTDDEEISAAIDSAIAETNALFSNWDPRSEVSLFNANTSLEPVEVSGAFIRLMETADAVHRASDGQFDTTLGPLIELWGFGAPGPAADIPSDEAIAAALARTGQRAVIVLDPAAGTLRKTRPDASIYLAAIAKGAGIDAVADRLLGLGLDDFMVEIGGDLVAYGAGPTGQGWRIGIEQPQAGVRRVEEIVPVSGLGMATSGDYRNYFEEDGVRYSHIIDAETGRPVTHRTASVTVLAETAALADAWATALLALGTERGLPIAEEQGLAALFILRSDDRDALEFEKVTSQAFDRLLAGEGS